MNINRFSVMRERKCRINGIVEHFSRILRTCVKRIFHHIRNPAKILCKILIISVNKNCSVYRSHIFVQFSLSLDYIFKTTKTKQMRLAYIGNQSIGRTGYVDQGLDFSGVIRTHFNHGNFHIGSNGKQRQRYANVIIQITASIFNLVFLSQHGGNQFLGGCFSIRSRNSYDGNVQLLAVIPSQILQKQQRVVNHDTFVRHNRRIGNNSTHGTLFECFQRILVTIKIFTF